MAPIAVVLETPMHLQFNSLKKCKIHQRKKKGRGSKSFPNVESMAIL